MSSPTMEERGYFPHGRCYTAILVVIMVTSWVLSDSSYYSCALLFSNHLGAPVGFPGIYTPEKFTEEDDFVYCTPYNAVHVGSFVDNMFMTARGFGIAASVISLVMMLVGATMCCVPWEMLIQTITIICVLVASFCQGMVFLLLKSRICSAGCSLAWGGELAISASVLMFGAAAGLCIKGQPSTARRDARGSGTAAEPLL